MYGLYAVVVHGGSLHGGHYTAYVKRRRLIKDHSALLNYSTDPIQNSFRKYNSKAAEEGKWFYTSDSHTSGSPKEQVQGCQAYLLFYERLPMM